MSTQWSDVRALEAASERLGIDPSHVTGLRLGRGVTHETVLLEHDGVPVAVLRLAPPDGGLLPGLDVAAEGRFLEHVPGNRLPVPELLLLDEAGVALGRPGLLLAYARGMNPTSWEELRTLGGHAAAEHALDLLLELHRPSAANGVGLDGAAGARLEAVERMVRLAPAPDREILAVLAALRAAPPAPIPPTWAHGDFRPANLMVDRGRIVGVLDWEMAGWGDPTRDLGIASMGTWGTWWDDAELLRRYHAGGGAKVTLEGLRWWRCMGYAMVAGFLIGRAAAGRPSRAALTEFKAGLLRARMAWEEAR